MGQLIETALALGALAVIGFVLMASMVLIGATIHVARKVWQLWAN